MRQQYFAAWSSGDSGLWQCVLGRSTLCQR